MENLKKILKDDTSMYNISISWYHSIGELLLFQMENPNYTMLMP